MQLIKLELQGPSLAWAAVELLGVAESSRSGSKARSQSGSISMCKFNTTAQSPDLSQ